MPRMKRCRDLVPARATAGRVLAQARQHLQGFLLRHDRISRGARARTLAYRRWLTTVRFAHPAPQIVLQDYIHAVEDAEARRDRLSRQTEELLPSWSMAPVVKALQAMRGVALVVAVTVVAEIGDFRRFANARQLMAYLGLAPSEHSSGSTIRRGGRQRAGPTRADRRGLSWLTVVTQSTQWNGEVRRLSRQNPLVRTAGDRTTVGNPPGLL
jgi:transposase